MLGSDEVRMLLRNLGLVKAPAVVEEVLTFVDDVLSVEDDTGTYRRPSRAWNLMSSLLHIPVFDNQRG